MEGTQAPGRGSGPLILDAASGVPELEDRISGLLRDHPGLGYVDGTGRDGEIWEIFLEGDEADALWDAVRPLLDSPPLWRTVEVTKQHGSGSHRRCLGSP